MQDVLPEMMSPYTMAQPPTSPGRALLSRALSHYCALAYGLSDAELAAGFAGAGGVTVAAEIALSTRLMGETLARGDVRAWARPMGGGEPVPLKASLWELDDFKRRFETSGLDLSEPFGDAAPTHWIFVDVEDWNAVVEAVLEGGTTTRRRQPASAPKTSVRPLMQAPAEPPTGDTKADTERLLRLPEVIRRVGLSKPTIYRRMERSAFPTQIQLSGGAVVWRESEIVAWIARQG